MGNSASKNCVYGKLIVALLSAVLTACGGGSSGGGSGSGGSSSGGSSGSSGGTQNAPPQITDFTLTPSPAYTNTDLHTQLLASDPDEDPLQTTFRWNVNGTLLSEETGPDLSHEYFVKGDKVEVTAEVSDGALTTSETRSLTISDSPATINASGVPETVQYGVPVSFTLNASDADGDAFTFGFSAQPNGMTIDDDGLVTWTPTGPMFEKHLDVYWETAIEQDGVASTASSTIRVVDENRKLPLARSGIALIVNRPESIASGDFTGDGKNALLITDNRQRLFTVAYDGEGYAQNWMYPYPLTEEDSSTIFSVAAGDIDGDGTDEIFAGLRIGISDDSATKIIIIDGLSGEVRHTLHLPGEIITAIRIDQVDGDDEMEIIALLDVEGYNSGEHRLVIYNAEDLDATESATPVWESPSLIGQSDIAIGDTDGDGTREIILSGGHIFGYSANGFESEWVYSAPFGTRIETGDLDGNGTDEIIGIVDDDNRELAVYDAVKRIRYTPFSGDISDIAVADTDGDNKAEILALPHYFRKMTLFSYTDSLDTPQTDWILDTNASMTTGLICDLDGDGTQEYVATTDDSSAMLVIAGENPEIGFEWNGEDIFAISGTYRGGIQENFNGRGNRLAFFASAGSLTPSYGMGMRAVLMNPVDGSLEWSPALSDEGSTSFAATLTDLGQDGDIEMLYTVDANPAMFSFSSESVVWTAPPLVDYGSLVAAGRINEDTEDDFAVVTQSGDINVYDPKNQLLLWGIPRNQTLDIAITDLNGDGSNALLALATSEVAIYGSEQDTATLENSLSTSVLATKLEEKGLLASDQSTRLANGQLRGLTTGDLDQDGRQEVILFMPYNYEDSWIIVLNDVLEPQSIALVKGIVLDVIVQNYGESHRNLLVRIADDSYHESHGQFIEIAPYSGLAISRSPRILPMARFNTMQYVDIEGDGISELSYGTYYSMNVTR